MSNITIRVCSRFAPIIHSFIPACGYDLLGAIVHSFYCIQAQCMHEPYISVCVSETAHLKRRVCCTQIHEAIIISWMACLFPVSRLVGVVACCCCCCWLTCWLACWLAGGCMPMPATDIAGIIRIVLCHAPRAVANAAGPSKLVCAPMNRPHRRSNSFTTVLGRPAAYG